MRKKNIKQKENLVQSERKILDWSDYQKAIFNNVETGIGHTIIDARAGSSKTSSLVESSYHINPNKKVIMVAFNKIIQLELESKLPKNIEAKTLHSVGFSFLRKAFGNIKLDTDKCIDIVSSFFKDKYENYDTISAIVKTVNFCKAHFVDTPSKIEDVINEFSIEFDLELEEVIKIVIKTLDLCKKDKSIIDYNDMIWLPLITNIIKPEYDIVFLDEAHDVTKAQLLLATALCKNDGRIFMAIDKFQAIYGWAGSNSRTFDEFKDKYNPTILPLPICYRCPKKVVELAQTIVSDIQAAPNAKDGTVIKIKESQFLDKVKVGDVILSRTNAQLITYCLKLLKRKIPATIRGRDIGSNLSTLVKKSKTKTIQEFRSWIIEWKVKESFRLRKKKLPITEIEDKADCLLALCDGCNSISELTQNLKKLFDDNEDSKKVLLSSIHKFKGLENDTVFILEWTLRSFSQEELNINYVGKTRSKDTMYLVQK